MKKIVLILAFCVAVFSYASEGKYVSYVVDGKTYEGYYSAPTSDAPLVFLVHDWDGLTDYEIKRAKMLYDMGYATFAVDMFGKGVKPQSVPEKKALTSALYADRTTMRKILYAGYAAAQKVGAQVDNAVGIGYCFGGTVLLEFARSSAPLKAFAPFHGSFKTPQGQSVGDIKGEVVVFHGSADAYISMEEFAAFAKELEAAKITHEMHTYSGAPHAFTVFDTPSYRPEADRKSWLRFSEYLKETFGN